GAEKQKSRPRSPAAKPRGAIPYERRERDRARQPEREMDFPVAAKEKRSQKRDEHAARGASRGESHVEGGEPLGRRTRPRELAVASHAAGEDGQAVRTDLNADRHDVAAQ